MPPHDAQDPCAPQNAVRSASTAVSPMRIYDMKPVSWFESGTVAAFSADAAAEMRIAASTIHRMQDYRVEGERAGEQGRTETNGDGTPPPTHLRRHAAVPTCRAG